MNRNEEYKALLSELESTPPELEYTVSRAQSRQKKTRCRRRAFLVPFGSLAAVFAAFAMMVNLSPNFAQAVSGIPGLSQLAEFVSFSPSLSTAVDNGYVQQVGQEQTEKGITARVEYMIADNKQINIFYTLDSEIYNGLDAYPSIKGADGTELHGFSSGSDHPPDIKNGDLKKVTVDFTSGEMPERFVLALDVFSPERRDEAGSPPAPMEEGSEPIQSQPEYLCHFEFTLTLDLSRMKEGEIFELHRELLIDGQRLILESAEIYPTHMRLNFSADAENTVWSSDLVFYVENEKGERFEGVGNGISAYSDPKSRMKTTYILESPYFSNSESLALHFTGGAWLDEEMPTARIDLTNKTADFLPEGVTFEDCERDGEDWILTFSAPELPGFNSNWAWGWEYYDYEGRKYTMEGISSGQTHNKPGISQILILKDYPYDEVWLTPDFTSRFVLSEPVVIEIK